MTLRVEQIIQFQTEGYLVVENVFADYDLDPVIAELEEVIHRKAEILASQGKIKNLYSGEPFDRRIALLNEECSEIANGLDIMEYRGEAIFRFLRNERLLDIVECILGSELMCNPIQHIRPKMPQTKNVFQHVPWHQDVGVTTEDSDHSDITTFWLPLIDATEETGCMQVLPGIFKRGLLPHHEGTEGVSIIPGSLPEVEPKSLPCPKGGLIIMNKYVPHRGMMNRSNRVRWSIDLRYHKTESPSGRPWFPSFVARSRFNPASAMIDFHEWSRNWTGALEQSKGRGVFYRGQDRQNMT